MHEHKFNIGDLVRRVGRDFFAVNKGNNYLVRAIDDTGLKLSYPTTGDYVDGRYLAKEFELVGKVVTPAQDPGGIYAGEADPSGISADTPGAKLDAGKLLPNLVIGEFSRALEAVTRVGTKGARKYTPRGWLEVENGEERYAEAALRHQLKVWQGKPIDDGPGGTGELHKAQVIWNLLAALELELRREEANAQS